MKPSILILSVEHSGTRFVKNHLLHQNWSRYQHLVPHQREYIERMPGMYDFTFVPLRAPMEIARSWARKAKPMGLLAERLEMLATMFEDEEPLWIPIDTPDRDEYVQRASEATGLDLDPRGWPKVGQDRTNNGIVSSGEKLKALAVLPAICENLEFFNRFYANPMEVDSGTISRISGAA